MRKCAAQVLSPVNGNNAAVICDTEMPKSKILPFEWYNTPNIHLLTIKDFYDFAKRHNFKIEKKIMHDQRKVK